MTKQKQNFISKTINNFLFEKFKTEIEKVIELNGNNELKIQELQKQLANQNSTSKSPQEQLKQFNFYPSFFNAQTRSNIKDKPEGTINPSILRTFSVDYPIVRACIDYIKNKTTHLDWGIIPLVDNFNENIQQELVNFFKQPAGNDSTMRTFQEQIIEDYLVMGAIGIEKLKTRGGQLVSLLPVDVGTIKVRVNENGRIPNPPEIAYEQWIMGTKVAELTKDDFILRIRNARTNTIFGLSPLESLILQVQSALAGTLYNWKFFTDSNNVEGFMSVPEDWTSDQISEFQTYFDAMVAGDPRYQRRIKMMPYGVNYISTKDPKDLPFERFELWLLEQTCAVFGVPPQDLGFTHNTNRATAEVQSEKGQERIGRALINFLEELFTNIIQRDLEYVDFEFKFINVNPTDVREEAEVENIKIKSGILSVDEVRIAQGLDPIGLEHYVMTGTGPMLVKDIINPATIEVKPIQQNTRQVEVKEEEEAEEAEEAETEELERKEILQWKKYCINSIKKGRSFDGFIANKISNEIVNDIKTQLEEANTKGDIVKIFSQYSNKEYKTIQTLKKMLYELNKI